MVDFEIDGETLKIKFVGDDADRQELMDDLMGKSSDSVFRDITEGYWTNGWGVHTGDELNQLTSCLVVVEDSTVEDNGGLTLFGKAWTNIHNYQIYCPVQTLIETGVVEFYLWDTFDGVTFQKWIN